jgi:hypothetical protein
MLIVKGANIGLSEGEASIVHSNFQRDFIVIKEAKLKIDSVKFYNMYTTSEFALAFSLNSELTLISISVFNLTRNLIYLENSVLTVNQSAFYNITHDGSFFGNGMIQCISCKRLLFFANNISSIRTNSSGGIFYLWNALGGELERFTFLLNNFTQIEAQNGGVIYSIEQSIDILNCSFEACKASDSGGIAYLKTELNTKVSWKIKNNIFIENSAKKGGAIHSLGKVPEGIHNNTYSGNKALYGPVKLFKNLKKK